MKGLEFVESVVPRGGTYCIVGILGKKVVQRFADNMQGVNEIIKEFHNQGLNIYFSMSSFKDDSARTQVNAKEIQSFFLDIDCGKDKAAQVPPKGYIDKPTALAAFRDFLNDTGLPHPTIVDSGGGWHIYWQLDQPMEPSKWYPLANAFKQLCIEKGLIIDPAVPADCARVLRVPNTYNHKRKSKVHFLEGIDIQAPMPLTQFESPLREICSSLGINGFHAMALPAAAKRELDETTKALLGNKTSKFSLIAKKSLQDQGCNQIKHCIINAATLDEPQWRSILSVAQACEDRDDAIHKVSKKHPEYTYEDTEQKANKTGGPYNCSTFEREWPSLCEGCPNKGKIKNPIQLGTVILMAEDNQITIPTPVANTAIATVQPTTTIQFPKLPFPYSRGQNGGIYVVAQAPDGSSTTELVYENDLFVMRRLKDQEAGEVLVMNLILPKDGLQEFTVPLKHIGSQDKLRDALAHHGVSVGKKKMDALMAYILGANRELQHQMKLEQSRAQFGWHDKDSTFIWGKKELFKGGDRFSPPSAQTTNLAGYMTPSGSYFKWLEIMQVLGRPGWETHQLVALAAFGAPLMRFTGEKGLWINMFNEKSGTGKTTVQHFINSVYGSSEHMMMRKHDTLASRYLQMGVLNNLPFCMDEVTNLSGEDASDLAYGNSEGRGRNRAESGVNKMRVNNTWWASILVTSSNSEMVGKLTTNKGMADAEIQRLAEFYLEKPEELDPNFAQGIALTLNENYGWAGEIYLQALVDDLDAAKAVLNKVKSRINDLIRTKSKERVWVSGFSALLAGGYIAKQLGIISWDIDALFNHLIELTKQHRDTADAVSLDFGSIIGEYLSENKGAILQINGHKDTTSGLQSAPIVNPSVRVVGRYEPDTNKLYLVRSAFREYCTRRHVPYNSAITHVDEGLRFVGLDRYSVLKGTGIKAPPVHVLVYEGRIEELENEAAS